MTFQADLEKLFGLKTVSYKYELGKEALFHEAIANDRGRVKRGGPSDAQKAFPTKLGVKGPLVYYTDPDCTGRRTKDTYAVKWPEVADEIWFKADLSPYDPTAYEGLLKRVIQHLNDKKASLYVKDVFMGSDPDFAVPYRFVGEYAAHAMFVHNMFPKNLPGVKDVEARRWTMLNVPSFVCVPERDGCRSEATVVIDAKNRICLVAGRADYCGVNKKTIFTVGNYLLPKQGRLSMHCSANVGKNNDAAILFGLSGTGKTTLSADTSRKLIGDDETIWSDNGLCNLEDGCYAKLINLDKQAEPVIAAALSQPGTIIENVPPLPGKKMEECHPDELDLNDGSIAENTRFSYPLEVVPNVMPNAQGPHPQTIVLLTADAYGVLPPVSILDSEDVMYHFVSGFTARVAGTEVGVTEPQPTFSACFGGPFMAQKPNVYAKLLSEKMKKHKARCILLNTGWSGGKYGVGKRMSIKVTRALLNAALDGKLDNVETEKLPILNLTIPKSCPGVESAILNPRNTWANKDEYDATATTLRDAFRENFKKKGFSSFGIEERI
ncbi:phosphoenolpyruvate carboxykinase (ATP) [Panacagrimonas perspica]|uniref:Phosphoenolpyruvate carboxykinase (ATP) n=1 Tax=Panacagrimonas perspica TaxID=381431 RepID=A0A4R7NWS7_9GAMM|nr:phosphoenolpyruvate carboxykinase (ATP) [Panacagrimonas perspica]TDU25683.1 phosphoenolpyruvate carboxykinase (ATP) [Panacagrimonas perspica]THD00702.1 phosphoenolpyruvate carboxykinase [Panacagrimonas perspica]